MTMFKTREQIEEIREKFYKWFSSTGYFPHAQGISDVAYIEGYTQAQQDIKEACSEGVDEWFLNHNWKPEELMSRQAGCRIAWQACALSKMKELQEKDAEIARLEKENEKLKVNLKVCQNDYWFMINLLEKYSSNKEQAIKDCIERMKFRSPIFKQESKE